MAFAYVQSWSNNGGGTTAASITTLSATGAAANNLLVAVICIRDLASSASFTLDADWTEISNGAGDVASIWAYRIATGDATDDLTCSFSINRRWAAAIAEYSGIATSSPLEITNENESNISATTSTTTTGSVTPSTSGAAIAIYAATQEASWQTTDITIDSSFTKRVISGNTGTSFRASCAIADLDLSSTSAQNPTWTNAVSINGSYAAIAAFAEAGGGSFAVTDVDLDETIADGQTGVVVTITGTVSATGKKVFITQGANSVEQTVTAQDASSATITVSYGGVLTAGAATLSVRNPL